MTKKASADTRTMFAEMSREEEFDTREEFFSQHRKELQSEFSDPKKEIKSSCSGFFKDTRHLGNHFAWLTGASPLNGKVEENLHRQLDLMYKVLSHKNKSVQFENKMKEVEIRCATEFSGSRTFRDINVLRQESDFVRFDSDNVGSVTSSPHLKAVQVENAFIFELWAEGSEIIGKMDLASAVAAFLHLSFTHNLQYPKGGQTVADILQRAVASYGDNTGMFPLL